MKKMIFFSLFSICTLSVFSQYDDEQVFKFGLGTSISIPLGDLKESASYGIGFGATGVYNISSNIAAFAQTDVNVFKAATAYEGAANILHIPLLGGARFKAGGFFAGAGIGYSLWTSDGVSANGFSYSPQVGYDFGRYHALLNYTGTASSEGTLSYLGLKAYYTF